MSSFILLDKPATDICMIIKETSCISKIGLNVDVTSITLDDLSQFDFFLKKIKKENFEERTLVSDYRNLKNEIINSCESKTDFILKATCDDRIIGVIDFFDSTLEGDPHPIGEIGISLLNKYSNQGIGSGLIKIAITYVTATNIKEVMLTVLESKKNAIHIYEKLGFKVYTKDMRSNGCSFYEMRLLL